MLIRYKSGGFSKIKPLREADHDSAVELAIVLQEAWIESGQDTVGIIEAFWQIIQALCQMIPTVKGLEWDFDALREDHELIERFFLHPDCAFIELHTFDPKSRVSPNALEDESVPLLPENLPFPSGGNDFADRVASYLHGTEWGPRQVQDLFEWLSREELSSMLWSLSELSNPDRRIDEIKTAIANDYGEIPFDTLLEDTLKPL